MNFKVYFKTLRDQGFARVSRDKFGDDWCAIYAKTVGDRRVHVQIWSSGDHSASHFLRHRMSTHPTEFKTVAQMLKAIDHELTRKDHPPRRPLKGSMVLW